MEERRTNEDYWKSLYALAIAAHERKSDVLCKIICLRVTLGLKWKQISHKPPIINNVIYVKLYISVYVHLFFYI